jgi:excisionase family DNA binding protein
MGGTKRRARPLRRDPAYFDRLPQAAGVPLNIDSARDRPFSVKLLAERWSCSEAHIRNMIRRGELAAFKLGGKLLRISAEEVERTEILPEKERNR